MREIKWRKIALNDLLGIVDYIASDNPDAAQRLHDEIKQKVSALAETRSCTVPGESRTRER